MKKDFNGLCFTNLVDYDMLYGHRNDVEGYAKALTYFDERLPELLAAMGEEDVLMITADHGLRSEYTVHGSFQRVYAACDVRSTGAGRGEFRNKKELF